MCNNSNVYSDKIIIGKVRIDLQAKDALKLISLLARVRKNGRCRIISDKDNQKIATSKV